MRRLVWMGLGAAAAVVLAERGRRLAHRYTPAGVTEQVEAAGQRAGTALHDAAATFRSAFASRERDLVSTLLVQPEGGDARAALRRPGRHSADGAGSTADAADDGYLAGPRDVPRGRPRGRVDDDEPLYDF
ncbi:hypothetical protein [Actinotalea solisilvae]|uniref:hypothetical protein n=1 Tax=Actinotalea solisilvae TaxID=2072922 RepID=UPI0018F21A1D|nr:hypothetical protein [Actinotalea solisilvae]